jgi:hypothetical protein
MWAGLILLHELHDFLAIVPRVIQLRNHSRQQCGLLFGLGWAGMSLGFRGGELFEVRTPRRKKTNGRNPVPQKKKTPEINVLAEIRIT